ncbi:MAG: helix-turn-helix transcriptional regulator [Corynebacterium variabile]
MGQVRLHDRLVPPGYLLRIRELRLALSSDTSVCTAQPHVHPEHLLFWTLGGSGRSGRSGSSEGEEEIEVGGCAYVVGQERGLFLPAGAEHTVPGGPASLLVATHIDTSAWGGESGDVHEVSVPSPCRELLIYMAYRAWPQERRVTAQRLCLDMLGGDEMPTVDVPQPKDERILLIAESILQDPADDRMLSDWAWLLNSSTRTLSRAFHADIGLSFSQWRTRVRMATALQMLMDGRPVGVVARRVGYATNSAFSASFRKVVGRSPSHYLADKG